MNNRTPTCAQDKFELELSHHLSRIQDPALQNSQFKAEYKGIRKRILGLVLQKETRGGRKNRRGLKIRRAVLLASVAVR